MATGLRVIPGDAINNVPVIDLSGANVRCPSYLGINSFVKDNNNRNSNITREFALKGIAGSDCFTIPDTTAIIDIPAGTGLQKTVIFLDGLTTTPTKLTAKFTGNYVVRQWVANLCKLRSYQILPATATQGFLSGVANDKKRYGIKLSNGSTNFFEVTDQALVGQCIWKSATTANPTGWITINQNWTLPTISGFGKERYLPFIHWNDPNVVLDYDPNSYTISVWKKSGVDMVKGSAKVQVVIFCDGAAVPAHNGGITMRNSKNQVTFSTAKTPFLLKGFVNSSGGAAPAGTARMMVPVIRTGIHVYQQGGWYHFNYRGLKMSNNVLSNDRGANAGSDTDQYGAVINPPGKVVSIRLPVIDAANYM